MVKTGDTQKNNSDKKLPEFEPELPWYNVHNVNAANSRGLVYDDIRSVYVDEDGCPVRDRYGQPIG